MQDRRVQGSPGGRAVTGHRAVQQCGVGPVDEVEGAVGPGEQERVALRRRFGQRVHRLRQGHVQVADAERAVQRPQGLGDGQAVQQAVDGADPQRIAGRVDQQDQAVVPGAGEGCSARSRAVGRPAVVAVGDQGLVGGQFAADHRQVCGVGDGPEAVVDAVLGGGREQRGPLGRAPDQGGRARRRPVVAPVGEEQRFQVGAGGPHQVRAVRDDVRHDVLVRQHQPLLGVRDAQRADHAPLHQAAAVALLVDVQAGFPVGGEHALGAPAAERLGGLGVALPGRAGLGQDQADDVVRVGGLKVVQAVGADHDVVGRGCHGGQAADPVGVVPEAAERGEFQPRGAVALE